MYDKEKLYAQLTEKIKVCQKCRLCKTALNAVPGEGSLTAKIAFVGEAPGATEDQTGRPFVGRAGMLLEKLLGKIGMKREDVWIGNIIKHRPPENRDPFPDEIAACEEYLTLQLKIIEPELVVTLGRFAMNYFYADGKISRDRGKIVKASGYNVFPIYHPAAALRNPDMMRDFAQDFVKIPQVLNSLHNAKFLEQENKNQLNLGI